MATQEKAPAPAETTTPTATDETVATAVPAQPRRGPGGLALAGIIGGGLVAAALLFSAGLAVGVALPVGGPVGIAQVGHPGGPGDGQGFPGQRDGQRPPAPQRDRGGDSE